MDTSPVRKVTWKDKILTRILHGIVHACPDHGVCEDLQLCRGSPSSPTRDPANPTFRTSWNGAYERIGWRIRLGARIGRGCRVPNSRLYCVPANTECFTSSTCSPLGDRYWPLVDAFTQILQVPSREASFYWW